MVFNKYLSLNLLLKFCFLYFIFFVIYLFTNIFLFEDSLKVVIYFTVFIFFIEYYKKPICNNYNFCTLNNFLQADLKNKINIIINTTGFITIIFLLKWFVFMVIALLLLKFLILNFKNSVFLYLLSALGYIGLSFVFIFHFNWLPEAKIQAFINPSDDLIVVSNIFAFLYIMIIYYFICAVLIYLSFIEYLIRGKYGSINYKKISSKVFNLFYYSGFLSALTPFVYALFRH